MAGPKLISAQAVAGGGSISLTFDQDIDPTAIDPTAFHWTDAAGNPFVGLEVEDASDEVLELNGEPGLPGYTSLSGVATMIRRNGVRGQVNHLDALPFVNRPQNAYPLSMTVNAGATLATVRWSENLTLDDPTVITGRFNGSAFTGATVATGDGTDVWHMTLTNEGPDVGPDSVLVGEGAGQDDDGQSNAPRTITPTLQP